MKRLFVDCDDVLLDFLTEFNKFAGFPEGYVPDSFAWGGCPEIKEQIDTFLAKQELLSPLDGAREYLLEAQKLGWTVTIITAYPEKYADTRLKNLSEARIPYSSIIFTTQQSGTLNKADIINDIAKHSPVHFVDDKLGAVNDLILKRKILCTGASVDVAYNQNCVKILQNTPILERRVGLAHGTTPAQASKGLYATSLRFLERQ